MIYGERIARQALFIDSDNECQTLERIPFMKGTFNEAWLQELIEDNPFLLPTSEIGCEYSPMVCIGREVPVGSGETQGYIDNLYLSPTGHIIIVETKLFRNQEARRAVVAQIIDYAKEIQKWDAEKLDSIVSEYFYKTYGQAFRCIDVMTRYGYLTYSDEARFTDAININLSKSSFLLLIVGDGIRTGVQQLADFLNENTSLSFNLALAELEMYKHNDGLIVIPNLLTKTTVIERTVISSSSTEDNLTKKQPIVDKKTYERKPILSRREFIDIFSDNNGFDPDVVAEFVSDIESINGINVEMAPTELTLRFSPEHNHTYTLLTLSISCNHSDFYIMPSRIISALEKHNIPISTADDFLNFFKDYVDVDRCKTPPYEYFSGFYYADVNKSLQDSEKFIVAIEHFVHTISKQQNKEA